MFDCLSQYKAARRVGTPLIAIQTLDPAATIKAITVETQKDVPLMQWDIMRGLVGINEPGLAAVCELTNGEAGAFADPIEMLLCAPKIPEKSVLFILNGHRFLDASAAFVQGLWNLRDDYKRSFRTAVI